MAYDEFYSTNRDGELVGEYLIERNPHICPSEHVILNGVSDKIGRKYFSQLDNICMVNGKSITPQRLNGADYDGDLVLVINEPIMKKGVHRDKPIVMDVDDKITSLAEEDTPQNRLALVKRTMNSLIGETSNCATGYLNKGAKTPEIKKRNEAYVDLLSVINGKAIDFAKTGVLFNIPRNIAKYSKPLPYFMKYASPYYAKQTKFNHAPSNMNRLCAQIEKWEKSFKWMRTYKDFDWHIMIDEDVGIDFEKFCLIEEIYFKFCEEMKDLAALQKEIRSRDTYHEEYEDIMSYSDAKEFTIDWGYYYDLYRNKCLAICPNRKMLANIAVTLCYQKYPNKSKKFMWRVAGDGIVDNIKAVDIELPIKDNEGTFHYLGKRYRKEKWNYDQRSS